MPQMMPLMWLFMLIQMITFLIMMSSFIFFFFMPQIKLSQISKSFQQSWLWKW